MPPALGNCVPKLPIGAGKEFDMSEVLSPEAFYVNLKEYQDAADAMEAVLVGAPEFDSLTVRGWKRG